MSTDFAIADVLPGKLNALVKNIMRQIGTADPNEAVRLVNSGEWIVSEPPRSWREEDGVIYFSVTSDGTSGVDWITRLESKGFRVGEYVKEVLRTPAFKPTSGVTTEVAVLKGKDMLFGDLDRSTSNIRDLATRHKLTTLDAEVACLIRLKFTDREIGQMGLWHIVVMHEPIKDLDGDRLLLNVDRDKNGCWLSACDGAPDGIWGRDGGFAFAVSVSQVGSQS